MRFKIMPINPNMELKNASLKKNKEFAILSIFYQITFLLGGLNHGFFRYKIVPVKLVKLYSLIICVILSVTSFLQSNINYDNFFRFSWYFLVLIKYNLFVLYLTFINDAHSFCNLLEELFLIDMRSGFDNIALSKVKLKIFCSNLAWICINLGSKFIFYAYVSNYNLKLAFSMPFYDMAISSELFILIHASMFFAVYSRFKQFIIILKKAESDFSSLQYVYKQYVDTIEKYKKAFDPTIIISLCCNIPEVMVSLYLALEEWRYHTLKLDFATIVFQYYFTASSFLTILIPPIIAGMLSTQAKLIKYILHDKLMEERDERAVYEIQRFIRYVEARGCQFRVYKLIPLDASLVGMVASFCVTYLIVIIQFTKLY